MWLSPDLLYQFEHKCSLKPKTRTKVNLRQKLLSLTVTLAVKDVLNKQCCIGDNKIFYDNETSVSNHQSLNIIVTVQTHTSFARLSRWLPLWGWSRQLSTCVHCVCSFVLAACHPIRLDWTWWCLDIFTAAVLVNIQMRYQGVLTVLSPWWRKRWSNMHTIWWWFTLRANTLAFLFWNQKLFSMFILSLT